jgi:hypothetical protein
MTVVTWTDVVFVVIFLVVWVILMRRILPRLGNGG